LNFGRNTDYSDNCPCYFSLLQGKFRDITSKYGKIASFHILTNSSFAINLPFDAIQSVPGGNVNILGGHSIGNSKQKSVYLHVSYSERFPRWSYFTVHCTDEQHAVFSHELQSALMLTAEFSKMYYTRNTVPTLSREQ
jgi:hypothetical protein